MKRLLIALLLLSGNAFAFNLWQDVQQNTQWTLGSAASAGTAVALAKNDSFNLKVGDFVPSFLASIADYRMLSLWWGGTQVKLADGTTELRDTAKIGLNLAYFLKGFTNQPPQLLQNLVIGPSASFNLVTSPHVLIPFLDCNYAFGGTSPTPQNPAPKSPPTIPQP